jgi:phosphatidylserine decarboxylase
MLDSLGSTLSGDTINAFYTSRGYDPETGELTLSEAVQALETELFKPNKERKRLDASDYHLAMDDTAASTPALGGPGAEGDPLGELDFAGPPGNIPDDQHGNSDLHRPNAPPAYDTEGNQQRLDQTLASGPEKSVGIGMAAAGSSTSVPRMAQRHASSSSTNSEVEGEESSGSGNSSPGVGQVERVINVKTCPLCHRPRMSRKGEVDIITHLAICASQDWERVDKIVVGNFVTSSQAQRKWMAKLISKVSSGAYKLGAVGF